MIYTLLVIIHVLASLFLIAVILLQAGRGGGLADSFGGSQMQNLFGTKSTNILTRLTTICAAVFIVSCLSLALISSYRSKSLVEKVKMPVTAGDVGPDFDIYPEEEQESEAPVEVTEEAGPDVDEVQ